MPDRYRCAKCGNLEARQQGGTCRVCDPASCCAKKWRGLSAREQATAITVAALNLFLGILFWRTCGIYSTCMRKVFVDYVLAFCNIPNIGLCTESGGASVELIIVLSIFSLAAIVVFSVVIYALLDQVSTGSGSSTYLVLPALPACPGTNTHALVRAWRASSSPQGSRTRK
jgi:hypothetical protein